MSSRYLELRCTNSTNDDKYAFKHEKADYMEVYLKSGLPLFGGQF